MNKSPLRSISLKVAAAILAIGLTACASSDKTSDDLPKVLLLTDSIGRSYVNTVIGLQRGKLDIRVPTNGNGSILNCEGTTKGVAEINQWLGDEDWDLIYFNFGLHDLMSVDPDNPSRASHNPNDPAQASPNVYEANLQTIAETLKATGAKLVFSNTIPFLQEDRRPFRQAYQVTVYNGRAEKVMSDNGIHVHDLHGFVKPRMEELMTPRGVNFRADRSLDVALQVSAEIDNALGIKSAQEADTPSKVLLLGDSVSLGYTPFVRGMLHSEADVYRPQNDGGGYLNCAGTLNGVANIDNWLGDGDWDAIHFNFGLHDLKHVYPGQPNKNSTDPSHPQQSDLAQYERNLTEIVGKLKATGAKLIFATTTPYPDKPGGPLRRADQPAKYNAVAERIMKENGIAINDLHDLALPRVEALMPPSNVHFNQSGSLELALQVAAHIEDALN